MIDPERFTPAARRYYAALVAAGAAERIVAEFARLARKGLASGWPAVELRKQFVHVARVVLAESREPRSSHRWAENSAFVAEIVDQIVATYRPPTGPPTLRLVGHHDAA